MEPAFAPFAADVLDGILDRDPVEATYLGDHARDGRLPDPSPAAAAARATTIRTQLAGLDAQPPTPRDEQVDAAIVRAALAAELLDLDDIREAEWNPMLHNPGGAVHSLISREFAPIEQRLAAAVDRLAAVPDYLAAARERLVEPSRIHLDTAVAQLDGTLGLLDTALLEAVPDDPQLRRRVADVAATARAAVAEHRDWLAARREAAVRDPRLGETRFRAKLALTLDTAFEPESLLARAERDLERVTWELTEQAGRLAGDAHPDAATVRAVLDRLAAEAPDDATILDECRGALTTTTDFVRTHDLVTIHDDPVVVVAMPEIDRGVAVAYCRDNGPLETATLPTEFAVSPTPPGWDAERVASFYREYNSHMVQNLAVHEAMPGHALQLMHARRHRGTTAVRTVLRSGSFVEGWAVYAEELMVERGYRGAANAQLRMQQLKMQLRSIINTLLDVRFHCGDLDEAGALELMTVRGFQEPGEAVGKWRRVQLTSTQLCTYYVGYTEVREVVRDLRSAHPGRSDRQVHDAVLAHGSPPARHLRTLLGLRPAG